MLRRNSDSLWYLQNVPNCNVWAVSQICGKCFQWETGMSSHHLKGSGFFTVLEHQVTQALLVCRRGRLGWNQSLL